MKRLLYTLLVLLPFLTVAQVPNTWTKKNDFTGLKRARAAAFSIGEYGYVCGGVDTSETVLKDLWKYDPKTDSWVQKADLPGSVRREAIAFTIDDLGYVGTGIDSNEAQLGNTLSDFWQYNPVTNTWAQKASFPGFGGLGIYFATGFSIDSKGYLCCGKIGPNFYSNQLWEYKPLNDSWTQRANFPGGVRYQLSSFVIGYEAFVGLGTDQDIYRKDLYRYSAGTNQWTACTDIPGPPRGGAASFSIGWRGFICTGTNGGMLDDLWEYNPFSNAWSVRSPYGGSERKNSISFVMGDTAYVGLGSGYSGKKESMHAYFPLPSVFVELSEDERNNFAIYPNPIAEYFILQTENSEASSFVIYSISGRKVLQDDFISGQKITLNHAEFQSGVYLVALTDRFGKEIGQHQKIIVQ